MGYAWRSLSRVIHPQLPLSQRESGKLLNALTSSFRKHLDDAHPTRTTGTAAERDGGDDTALPPHSLSPRSPSAASAADDHLATVLTSPLFLPHDTTRPKVASHTPANPDLKDFRGSIVFLDETLRDTSSDVAIVGQRLKQLYRLLHKLPSEQQDAQVEAAAPGRKVLEWLYQHCLFETSRTWLGAAFLRRVCNLLIREGRENDIWTWIKLDLPSKQTGLAANAWKGLLLAALIGASKPTPRRLDVALNQFMVAAQYKDSAPPESNMHWLDLYPAHCEIMEKLVRADRAIRSSSLDKGRFDAYARRLQDIEYPEDAVSLRIDKAWIYLLDPHQPDAGPALRLIKQHSPDLSAAGMTSQAYTHGLYKWRPRTMRSWAKFLLDAAAVLEAQGRSREANRIRTAMNPPRALSSDAKRPQARSAESLNASQGWVPSMA